MATLENAVCTYHFIEPDVHEFVLRDAHRITMDAYVALWEEKLVPFWRGDARFTGEICLLVNMTRLTEPPPFAYVVSRSRRIISQLPDIPSFRTALLINPLRNLTQMVATYSKLADKDHIVNRRFFMANERDAAIAWLLDRV